MLCALLFGAFWLAGYKSAGRSASCSSSKTSAHIDEMMCGTVLEISSGGSVQYRQLSVSSEHA